MQSFLLLKSFLMCTHFVIVVVVVVVVVVHQLLDMLKFYTGFEISDVTGMSHS